MCFSLFLSKMCIVLHQTSHHFPWRNEFVIIVPDGLQFTDMADTPNGCAAYTAHTFSQRINSVKDLLALLVKELVVVAEVRACQVPVEIFGFDVEGKEVGNKGVERLGYCL